MNLLIRIDTNQTIYNSYKKSYPVMIHNLSNDTTYIGFGWYISIITEALTRKGEWKPIEKPYHYGCAFGLESIILPPKEIVITSELIYSGDFKTQLRLKIGKSVSKAFYGSINESQFNESPHSY